MKKFLFIFIFISTIAFCQEDSYYWNDVGITLQQLFDKMGVPDGIEYQQKSRIYWFAYDFGEAAVIYIVDKGFISSVLYMKNSKNPEDINNTFLEMNRISSFYGFFTYKWTGMYIKKYRNGIELTGNITDVKGEYVLTILVTKMEQK